VPEINYCPQPVVEKSAQYKGRLNRPKMEYTYYEYLNIEELRRAKKRAECTHAKVAIICTCCGTHFEKNDKMNSKPLIKKQVNK
jgi:hypothetical protein